MQAYFHAILIGLVEGLTEFLPVSSTGHIILAESLLGFAHSGKAFEIVIQSGAILAICWLYRARLMAAVCGLHKEKAQQRFVLHILLAFLPAMVVGVFAHDFIKTALFNMRVVSISMVVGGVAILLIEKFRPAPIVTEVDALTPRKALQIGLCQLVAMIPGVSRSGATIMGAMMLKVDRKAATEFSFFLAIPTILAASVYDLLINWSELSSAQLDVIGIGFIASFISALVVVKWFIRFVTTHSFRVFAWYRIVAGIIMLAVM